MNKPEAVLPSITETNKMQSVYLSCRKAHLVLFGTCRMVRSRRPCSLYHRDQKDIVGPI
jgi:hypothetical protein